MSKIEWTDTTWNPATGCNKVSPGCKNCYAERMSKRLKAMGQNKYKNGFKFTTHDHALRPSRSKRPRMIFVNSMSDTFHEEMSIDFLMNMFDVMRREPHNIFQLLTKRSARLAKLSPTIDWPDNVWVGVSVENSDYTYRIDYLRSTGARVKFLSLEPLLGPLRGLNLSGIDWVIVGGESGPRARPMEKEWVTDIRDQCLSAGVPFFFKQWGGVRKKETGRVLDGRTWDEMPYTIEKRS